MTMAKQLKRRKVVETLLAERGDLLVIGGLGAPAWDITAAGDHANNFPMWGAMGGAAVLGLGLALAQPKRQVLVVTGDGEMLMGIGSLATIGISKAPNLSIVVLDNEAYGETGQQDTATKHGVSRDRIHEKRGSLFAQIKIDPEKMPLVLPPRDSTYIKNRMRISILGEAALHD
ncbi:MAG: aldehyde dehydrogenase [Betaproteobacteria bacterium]|nr:aldehyde dehydrogenase [Betaproteobacteria bacterium]